MSCPKGWVQRNVVVTLGVEGGLYSVPNESTVFDLNLFSEDGVPSLNQAEVRTQWKDSSDVLKGRFEGDGSFACWRLPPPSEGFWRTLKFGLEVSCKNPRQLVDPTGEADDLFAEEGQRNFSFLQSTIQRLQIVSGDLTERNGSPLLDLVGSYETPLCGQIFIGDYYGESLRRSVDADMLCIQHLSLINVKGETPSDPISGVVISTDSQVHGWEIPLSITDLEIHPAPYIGPNNSSSERWMDDLFSLAGNIVARDLESSQISGSVAITSIEGEAIIHILCGDTTDRYIEEGSSGIKWMVMVNPELVSSDVELVLPECTYDYVDTDERRWALRLSGKSQRGFVGKVFINSMAVRRRNAKDAININFRVLEGFSLNGPQSPEPVAALYYVDSDICEKLCRDNGFCQAAVWQEDPNNEKDKSKGNYDWMDVYGPKDNPHFQIYKYAWNYYSHNLKLSKLCLLYGPLNDTRHCSIADLGKTASRVSMEGSDGEGQRSWLMLIDEAQN